jgi:glyoxylate/hydroxypyruvate reductase
MAGYPNLQLIQSLWAGVDRLLGDPTLPAAVPIARLVDPALTQAMVESVCTHVLMQHRQIPQYLRQQRDKVWAALPQPSASECTVGILGFGTLGTRCAEALHALGFRVAGWATRTDDSSRFPVSIGSDGFVDLLSQSQIIVNLLPSTGQTFGILNRDAFALMRSGSALINVGRGAQVVDDDLLDALDTGRISHAILDVFVREPLPPDHRYWTHDRVTVLPHVAATTTPSTAAAIVAENIGRLRRGEPLHRLVDRSRGY